MATYNRESTTDAPPPRSNYEVVKRTFAAKNFPKGSQERAQLNLSVVTSEYMPSYRYCVVDGQSFGRAYRTKSEAEKGRDNYDAPN